MMEAIRSYETSALTKNTRRKIREDGFLHNPFLFAKNWNGIYATLRRRDCQNNNLLRTKQTFPQQVAEYFAQQHLAID
jgi:hypothetical protein